MARKDERRDRMSAREVRNARETREEQAPFSAAENQEASEELAPRDATRPGAKQQLRADFGRPNRRKR